MPPASHKIVIITAPSGSGKTTITRQLLQHLPQLAFSVSATTRQKRGIETDGKDYHFLDIQSFRNRIEENAFLEWEMVYEGKYYGTLMAEVERIWSEGRTPLLDIDVQGGLKVIQHSHIKTLSLFIQAPNIPELEKRLRSRGTDTEESIRDRLAKASLELSYAHRFDRVIVNDVLEKACKEAIAAVENFLSA